MAYGASPCESTDVGGEGILEANFSAIGNRSWLCILLIGIGGTAALPLITASVASPPETFSLLSFLLIILKKPRDCVPLGDDGGVVFFPFDLDGVEGMGMAGGELLFGADLVRARFDDLVEALDWYPTSSS